MYNEITCDKVKHILGENMFYNAIHLDTLNYMAEENTFAGCFCNDDAVFLRIPVQRLTRKMRQTMYMSVL